VAPAAPAGLADGRAPYLRVMARRGQRPLRTGVLRLRVGCDEPCAVVASGRLTVRDRRGRRAQATPRLAVRTTRRRLRAGRTLTVRVRIGPHTRRRARRAVKRNRRVEARMVVRAVDPAGNPKLARIRVKLRR